MAINMQDKLALINEIIPPVSIYNISAGIKVTSDRIADPVIIPMDPLSDVNKLITKEGVTVWNEHLKPRFVPFDYIRDLPGHTFIKFKPMGKNVFNIPHGCPADNNVKPVLMKTSKPSKAKSALLSNPPPPPPPEMAQQFIDSISAATTGLDFGTQTQEISMGSLLPPPPPPPELAENFMESISAATFGLEQKKENLPTDYDKEWQEVQDFMSSVAAATTGLDLGSSGQLHQRPLDRIEEGLEFTASQPKETIEDVTEDNIIDTQTQ